MYFCILFLSFSLKRREKEKNFQKKTKKKKRKRKKKHTPTTHHARPIARVHTRVHNPANHSSRTPSLLSVSSLSSGRHERIDRELGLGPAGAPLVGREASHRPTPGRSPSIARLLGSALDALPQAARSRTSPGCPVSRSPPQPRPRGGGARDATRSRARCPTPGRAAFPSPDLSAARRELQVLLSSPSDS